MASNLARCRPLNMDEWQNQGQPLHVKAWRLTAALHALSYSGKHQSRSPRLHEIEEAIEGSRPLTDLPEDWDDAGAKQISKSTWSVATELLRNAARTAYRRYCYSLPVPNIGPCADGSIDLYWSTAKFTLLINVRPDDGKHSDYYGELTDSLGEQPDTKVQGPLDPVHPNFDFLRLLVEP
jgi:hypothetical protein